MTLKIESLPIEKLKFDPTNARKHSNINLSAIAESLKQFGQRKPIVITADNVIVAGNGTVEAARLLGLTDVDVVRVPKDWSADQVKAFALADNRTAELAEWNPEVLSAQLLELDEAGFDIEALGFEAIEPAEIANSEKEEIPPVTKETRVALNDVWILGNHRLVCGDSSDPDILQKLLNGETAELVFTDPPYRYKTMGAGGVFDEGYKKLKKDLAGLTEFDPSDFLKVLPGLFQNGINAYIFCNTDLVPDYCLWARQQKYNFNILTWHKNQFIPASNNHHYPDTEYLIYISKSATFNTGLSVNYGKYFVLDNEKSEDHPTIKPLDIIQTELKISSTKNGIVVDLFAGSGSTLIACELEKRKGRMVELDPQYCEVIIQRWEKLTGEKAVLENAGR
jgi:DNA modification methylase